jgi:excisionase family DNA binding protein
MHRRLQSGMRENPASDRRHGLRSESVNSSSKPCSQNVDITSSEPMRLNTDRSIRVDASANAAPPHAATAGEGRNHVGTRRAVAIRNGSAAKTAHSFEPLISSCEAARLLGNIHVKTLQRYARRRRVPGYQIGGHWYFRASELDSWLQSRINLSCHPCRLQEESDGT